MDFYPDYHEHDDFQPAMLALSHFIIQWNWAEHNFNVLLWALSGDFLTGAQYTTGLSNQSRADLVLARARRTEKDPDILKLIEFSVKAFGCIKDNRNSLAHAHSISWEKFEEKPRWLRASKNPKSLHVYCFADISDITENLTAACKLAILLTEITGYYIGNPPKQLKPSLDVFSLPTALKSIPIYLEELGSGLID